MTYDEKSVEQTLILKQSTTMFAPVLHEKQLNKVKIYESSSTIDTVIMSR